MFFCTFSFLFFWNDIQFSAEPFGRALVRLGCIFRWYCDVDFHWHFICKKKSFAYLRFRVMYSRTLFRITYREKLYNKWQASKRLNLPDTFPPLLPMPDSIPCMCSCLLPAVVKIFHSKEHKDSRLYTSIADK